MEVINKINTYTIPGKIAFANNSKFVKITNIWEIMNILPYK